MKLDRYHFLVFFCLCAAIAVRWCSVQGGLWFDEIISFTEVKKFSSALDIFRGAQFDNNHLLNSLWLYALDPCAETVVVRFPSFLFSACFLALLIYAPFSRERVRNYFFFLLVAFSYLFILYGTEARGYSLMILLCYLSWILGIRVAAASSLSLLVIFHLAAALSMLAHLSAALFILPLLLYLCCMPSPLSLARRIATIVLPQMGALGVYYLIVIRHLPPGSGTFRLHFEVVINTLSLLVGGGIFSPALASSSEISSFSNEVMLLSALFVAVLLGIQIVRSWKERRAEGLFFLCGCIIVPAAVLLLQPRVLYERYFLASSIIAYMALASFLGDLWERNKKGKVLSVVLLALIITLNGKLLIDLLTFHRGQYEKIIEIVIAANPSSEIVLGSDHEIRNLSVFQYYLNCTHLEKRIVYLSEQQDAGKFPEWYITHSQDSYFIPEKEIMRGSHSYQFVESGDSAILSGWRWFLYELR